MTKNQNETLGEFDPIYLKPKPLTLADVVLDLIKSGSPWVRTLSEEEFMPYLRQGDHIEYEMIPVRLSSNDKDINVGNLYAGFIDNGYFPFDPKEDLTLYPIQKIEYFQNIRLDGVDLTHRPIVMDPESKLDHWEYEYNLETIWEDHGLDNGVDVASFAGFFVLHPGDRVDF